ncbi:MAG: PRC-barrel domain-containing protein [Sulfitobacter sp.]|nr:PRC-barrel domain-containing protein [Sulfitobacter sp.]
MKRFLSTTAILMTLAGTAMADGHAAKMGQIKAEQGDFFASDLIGMRIWKSEVEVDTNATVSANATQEWDNIGEINDIIITEDGDVRAVILGVGGFLGMGERDVSVSMDDIKVLTEDGDRDSRFLVVTTTTEALETAPAFERTVEDAEQMAENTAQETEEMAENAAAETEQTAENMAAETEQMAEKAETELDNSTMATGTMLERPNVARDGYTEVTMSELSNLPADRIEGSYVYGANDETVGEIDALLLDGEGKVAEVVVNVGGFLGLGEKPVAVSFEELQFLQNKDGDDLRIYIDATEEKLEAKPEYTQ